MKLPINIHQVIREACDISQAQQTPVFATIYIDETSSSALQAMVRSAFSSDAPNARVSISYFPSMPVIPFPGADLAVIVAGSDPSVGKIAADIRSLEVPVLVVTEDEAAVIEQAEAQGAPLLIEDIIAPAKEVPASWAEDVIAACKRAAEQQSRAASEQATELDSAQAAGLEAALVADPLQPVNEEDAQALASASAEPGQLLALDSVRGDMSVRMGEWVLVACHRKRLACALAFPVVRRPLSIEAVHTTAFQNAGVGAVNFIKGADMPIMTLNQVKMALQIAAAFGHELSYQRVKEIIGVVGSAFFLRGISRKVQRVIPVPFVVNASLGYLGTLSIGYGLIAYFEGNGTLDALIEKLIGTGKQALQIKQVIDEHEGLPARNTEIARTVSKRGASSLVQGARFASQYAIPAGSDVVQGVKLIAKSRHQS